MQSLPGVYEARSGKGMLYSMGPGSVGVVIRKLNGTQSSDPVAALFSAANVHAYSEE